VTRSSGDGGEEHSRTAAGDAGGGRAAAPGADQARGGRDQGGRSHPWWGAGFDVVRRGYERSQVEEALDRAEAELRTVTTDREELAHAESRAQNEIQRLRREIDRLAATPISLDGLSGRMQHMLRLAEQEAESLRHDATARAHVLEDQARHRARDIVKEAGEHAATTRETSEGQARGRVAQAQEQAQEILEEAGRQARQLHSEAREAARQAEEARSAAETDARELTERTRLETERLERDAASERTRRDQEAQERRMRADQDFESALAARRAEAATALADAEARRRAAEQRGRDAEAQAEARVAAADASTEELGLRRRRVLDHLDALRQALDAVPRADKPQKPVPDPRPSSETESADPPARATTPERTNGART